MDELGRRLMFWLVVLCGLMVLPSGLAFGQSEGASGGQSGQPAEAVVTAQRMGDHGDRTRFVLEFSREADFSILTLTDPERILLDFAATDWRATSGGSGVGLIRRTDVSSSSDGERRVLLTLTEPVAVADVFFIPSQNGEPVRFVMDIVPAVSSQSPALTNNAISRSTQDDRESAPSSASADAAEPGSSSEDAGSLQTGIPSDVPRFPRPQQRPSGFPPDSDGAGDRVAMLDSVSAGRGDGVSGGSAQRRRMTPISQVDQVSNRSAPDIDTAPLPPLRPSDNSVASDGAESSARSGSGRIASVDVTGVPFDVPMPPTRPDRPAVRTVVIDPGHGGIDPGAIGASGTREKAVVLSAARMLRDALRDRGGYRVVLTRDGDDTLRLRDRVRIAREADGDLFLSIHADSMANERVRGASVYTLSEVASDREAEMLAARENRADALAGVVLDPNDDMVASILIDLAQRDTKNQSRLVADHLVSSIGSVSNMLSNSHRQAGFAVLTAPDVPSALIELGYLSNESDERLLSDSDHVQTLANTIADAVDNYFRAPNLVGLARR